MSNDILIQQYQGRTSGYNLLSPYFRNKDINNIFGLDETSTNKDLWNWLGKYNQYCWIKRKLPTYILTEKIENLPTYWNNTSSDLSKHYYGMYESLYVDDTGVLQGANPIDKEIGYETQTALRETYAELINHPGAYILDEGDFSGDGVDRTYVLQVPDNPTYAVAPDEYTTTFAGYYDSQNRRYWGAFPLKIDNRCKFFSVTIKKDDNISLVYSTNKDAFPMKGNLDGYNYIFCGNAFEKMNKMITWETGTYLGTGVYGDSSPNSIVFSFIPKIVIITVKNRYLFFNNTTDSSGKTGSPLMGGIFWQFGLEGTTSGGLIFNLKETTLSWYTYMTLDSGEFNQFNGKNIQYSYIALG